MMRSFELPYGAFELKSRYQRNMLIGTTTAVLLATALISLIWILGCAAAVETQIVDPPGLTDSMTIIFVEPSPPGIDDIRGGKGIKPPPPSKLDNGIFVAVDDLLAEEDTVDFSELHKRGTGEYDPEAEYGEDGDQGEPGGLYIGPEVIPPVGAFIAVEVGPVIIHEQKPEYPRLALEGGFTASVFIDAFVGREGQVLDARVARCTRNHMGFEEAALKAAYKCTYRPAIQNGAPVGVWISYQVDFVLDRSR